MKIPKLTPEQIELWVSKNFEYKKRKNGEELLICNPFIPGDTKFKFNISTIPKKSKNSDVINYWVHDWRPSAKQYNGSLIKFVQRYKGCSYKEALKELGCNTISYYPSINKEFIKKRIANIESKNINLPNGAIPINDDNKTKLLNMVRKYLECRGITIQDAISFRLQYTPSMVIFPYFEYDNLVYWQGRTFSSINKRFLFPGKMETTLGKSDFLYGFDNVEYNSKVYIVEAIFCALTLGANSVAIGGAKLSDMQIRKLKALNPHKVVLAPDNDREGYSSVYYNWKLLHNHFDLEYVLPYDGFKDWNDIIQSSDDKQSEIKKLRKYIDNNSQSLNLKKAIKFRRSVLD